MKSGFRSTELTFPVSSAGLCVPIELSKDKDKNWGVARLHVYKQDIWSTSNSKKQEFNTSSGDMRIFNLWKEKGEGQQREMDSSMSNDSLLMRLISQCKQIGIPPANGFKQQLLIT